MEFKNWMENLRSGEWQTFQGMGYTVEITQFSNKGPLFIIKQQGQEVGRGYFDLLTMKWKLSE